jgi:hypothetical protein
MYTFPLEERRRARRFSWQGLAHWRVFLAFALPKARRTISLRHAIASD